MPSKAIDLLAAATSEKLCKHVRISLAWNAELYLIWKSTCLHPRKAKVVVDLISKIFFEWIGFFVRSNLNTPPNTMLRS